MQNFNNMPQNMEQNMQQNMPQNMQQNMQQNMPQNIQTDEKYKKEYEEKKLKDKEKEKTRKEKDLINNLLRKYRGLPSKEKYPKEIYYSKLLIDEKKKGVNKGVLFTQRLESKLNLIENIKEKYSIDENLFIQTDYDIESLEEEDDIKSKMVIEEKEKVKKVIPKPKIFLNTTYETLVKSFENSTIPPEYHKILAILNLSYEDYNNFNEIYHFEIKNNDDIYEKMIENIETTLIEKIPKIKKIPNLTSSLTKFLESFKKIMGKKISNETAIIPNEFSLFILFHNLVIEKSFWMLIPEKNREFLLFLIERILELVDERNKEITYYINENDEKLSTDNFRDTIKNITKKYTGDVSDEFIKNFITNNNLDEEEGLIENYELKIIPDRKYYDEQSFSLKWEKLEIKKKRDIFNLFPTEITDENLIILLISTGSKGVIQYLLISALLIINSKESSFSKYLIKIQPNNGYSLIQNLTNDLKEKIFITTNGFESKTKEPYQLLLEFVWAEFQTIHAKTKKELKKEKQEQKEAVQKNYENIRVKKARQQEADYNQKNKGI